MLELCCYAVHAAYQGPIVGAIWQQKTRHCSPGAQAIDSFNICAAGANVISEDLQAQTNFVIKQQIGDKILLRLCTALRDSYRPEAAEEAQTQLIKAQEYLQACRRTLQTTPMTFPTLQTIVLCCPC